ncbi:hypothetical protein niasHT_015067 [Heterodera trifolii]|uniref:RING-type domain-containing protein n=1 Tax=Heterodera trifolii TaxID=157864 RepID=A0ABD2L9K1_9BILA
MSGATANSTSAPAANTSSSSATVSSSTIRAQHNQQPQSSSSSTSSWMNGTTFSVSISTPVEDLNIQFPPIQLPSGISTLFGELAAAHHQQQQQQQMAAIGSSSSTAAASVQSGASSASSSTSTVGLLQRQNGIDASVNSAPSASGPMAIDSSSSSELSAGPAQLSSTSNCGDQTPQQQQQQKHRHDQWSSSSRANSSPPATLWTNSSSNTTAAGSKGRPTNAAAAAGGASPSYIIPMHTSEFGSDVDNGTGPAVVAVGTGPGWQQHQIVVNGAKENARLTTTGAVAAVPSEDNSNNNEDNGGAFVVVNCSSGITAPFVGDAPQQRRRRNSNSVLRTSQSADRLSRTARRASRPRNTTVAAASGGGGGHRRHTQSVASFVNAAYAAAAQAANNNTNGTTSAGGGTGSNNNNTNNTNNRDSIITTTASTDSSSTSSNSTVNGGAGGGGDENGGGGGGNNNNMRNLRQHLRTLFEMRHVAFRQIIQQAGEFPSLFMVGGVFCALCVLVVVLMHFFVSKLVATLALLFSVSHFSDAFAFKRFVTGGQPSGWLIAAKILFRQFMVGTVLGQTQWALPSLVFQPVQHHEHQHQAVPTTTTPPPPEGEEASDDGGTFFLSPYLNSDSTSPTFSSTLYITILAQFFVMDLLLLIKLCVSSVPSSWLGASTKRRIYQWAEYSCALYRFMLPFMPWNAYFGAIWWTVLYGGIKLLFGLALVWAWVLATLRFFRSTHIGSLASEAECGQGEQCTICFSDFRAPIKLKCSHIFCTECIRTWLDREVTCPICRAVVTREDNHFRNGDSMLPCVF